MSLLPAITALQVAASPAPMPRASDCRAKTIELINESIHVEIPQGDETIVLDAQTIEDLMTGRRGDVSAEEIEKQITARIARHLNNPVFI